VKGGSYSDLEFERVGPPWVGTRREQMFEFLDPIPTRVPAEVRLIHNKGALLSFIVGKLWEIATRRSIGKSLTEKHPVDGN